MESLSCLSFIPKDSSEDNVKCGFLHFHSCHRNRYWSFDRRIQLTYSKQKFRRHALWVHVALWSLLPQGPDKMKPATFHISRITALVQINMIILEVFINLTRFFWFLFCQAVNIRNLHWTWSWMKQRSTWHLNFPSVSPFSLSLLPLVFLCHRLLLWLHLLASPAFSLRLHLFFHSHAHTHIQSFGRLCPCLSFLLSLVYLTVAHSLLNIKLKARW